MEKYTKPDCSTVTIEGEAFSVGRKLGPELWELTNLASGQIIAKRDSDVKAALVTVGRLPPATRWRKEYGDRVTKTLFDTFPRALQEDAMQKMAFVLHVLEEFPQKSSPKSIVPLIKPFWALIKNKYDVPRTKRECPSADTVYRWVRTYLIAGRSVVALIDLDRNKGNRKARKPELVALLTTAIDTMYMKLHGGGIKETFEYFEALVRKADAARKPDEPPLPAASERLIRSAIGKIPYLDRLLARKGPEAARRAKRGVYKHYVATAPLHILQGDEMKWDVMVLDDISGLPLGCPRSVSTVDVFTRSFHGIHTAYAVSSFAALGACLKFGIRPKTDLGSTFGPLHNEWGCYGIGRRLVLDNALANHGAGLESACLDLGMAVEYSGRKTPWEKAFIERAQGTMNREVCSTLPGKTFANIFMRGDYDPEKHAILFKHEFEQRKMKWIVDIYHQRPHRVTHEAPASMWRRYTAGMDIRTEGDLAILDLIFAKPISKPVQHYGIELNSLFYNSPELGDLARFAGFGKWMNVREDDENLGRVFVKTHRPDEWIVVPALDASYADGLTLWQHQTIRAYSKRIGRDYTDVAQLQASKDEIRDRSFEAAERCGLKRRTKGRFHDEDRRTNAKSGADASQPHASPTVTVTGAGAKDSARPMSHFEPDRVEPTFRIRPTTTMETHDD